MATSSTQTAPAGPATVADVVARLCAIEASAEPGDGVACFARLYREVTEAVRAELGGEQPARGTFVETLDVRFAGLFFQPLDTYASDPGHTPRAWLPLFAARGRRGVAPLQFALAGMNAHINRDLPVALVTTAAELGVSLDDDSAEHADFEGIDALLAHVEQRIKPAYLTGWLAKVDRLVHRCARIDDVVAMWDVSRARDAAWTNGHALWRLRGEQALADAFLDVLDRTTGLAGRGLLIPADTVLGRLARLLERTR